MGTCLATNSSCTRNEDKVNKKGETGLAEGWRRRTWLAFNTD